MADWHLSQMDPAEQLAKLHYFSMKKRQAGTEIEFTIVVREFVPQRGNDQSMLFFAQADKQTNQSTAPFTPVGWGSSLEKALSECIQSIHRFPYEGPLPDEGEQQR